VATIGADQPGMGMTNRVMLAQGEERGASYTLIWLDGDDLRKFQSFESRFFGALSIASKMGQIPNVGPILRHFFAKRTR
jgi:hypothetical protein